MTKRFVLGYNKIKDKEDNIIYGLTSIDNQDFGLYKFIEKANALHEENEELKKALWCIRKRYGYTIEEFVEDLKDNGTDLSKVDLK